jgi:hypothetical protein
MTLAKKVAQRYLTAVRTVDPAKLQKLLLWIRKNPKLEKPIKELKPAFDHLGWVIEPIRGGTKFTSPKGSTFETPSFYDFIGQKYPFLVKDFKDINTLAMWLTHNRFQDQVLEVLQMESIEIENERRQRDREERARVGKATCPCCFGPFMLLPRAKKGDRSLPGIVLHGYRRPGRGYLEGECFGNGWPPFELSSEGTAAYLEHLDLLLKGLASALGRLERDEEDTLIFGLKGYSREDTPPEKWAALLEEATKQQKFKVNEVTKVRDLVQKKLASWEPHPELL